MNVSFKYYFLVILIWISFHFLLTCHIFWCSFQSFKISKLLNPPQLNISLISFYVVQFFNIVRNTALIFWTISRMSNLEKFFLQISAIITIRSKKKKKKIRHINRTKYKIKFRGLIKQCTPISYRVFSNSQLASGLKLMRPAPALRWYIDS